MVVKSRSLIYFVAKLIIYGKIIIKGGYGMNKKSIDDDNITDREYYTIVIFAIVCLIIETITLVITIIKYDICILT